MSPLADCAATSAALAQATQTCVGDAMPGGLSQEQKLPSTASRHAGYRLHFLPEGPPEHGWPVCYLQYETTLVVIRPQMSSLGESGPSDSPATSRCASAEALRPKEAKRPKIMSKSAFQWLQAGQGG